MKKQVKDSELREEARTHYRIGSKRILPSNKWYPALQKDNVNLVTDAIADITPHGIPTMAGHEIEVCDRLCNRVRSHRLAVHASRRRGERENARRGLEGWPAGVREHDGAGFPELLSRPGLQIGYSSQVFMIEAQLQYVIGALQVLQKNDVIDVKYDALRSWNDSFQRRMPSTVWMSGGCANWYVDRNGLATTVGSDFTWKFRQLTRNFDSAAYEALTRDSMAEAG